jgi:hypothetical protein
MFNPYNVTSGKQVDEGILIRDVQPLNCPMAVLMNKIIILELKELERKIA